MLVAMIVLEMVERLEAFAVPCFLRPTFFFWVVSTITWSSPIGRVCA